jgi:hypothetical protein
LAQLAAAWEDEEWTDEYRRTKRAAVDRARAAHADGLNDLTERAALKQLAAQFEASGVDITALEATS